MSWFSMFNRRRALLSCALAILAVLVVMTFWLVPSNPAADSPREKVTTRPVNLIQPSTALHQNQVILPEMMRSVNLRVVSAAAVIVSCVVALLVYVIHLQTAHNVTFDTTEIPHQDHFEVTTREPEKETTLTAVHVGLAALLILLLFVGIFYSVRETPALSAHPRTYGHREGVLGGTKTVVAEGSKKSREEGESGCQGSKENRTSSRGVGKEVLDVKYFEACYKKGKQVGSGWVATAYLATRRTDNQPFVVKISRRPVCVSTEAAILSQFDHENIVKFIEQKQLKEVEEKAANIYEYIDSGTLDDLVQSELKLNEDALSAIASQLLCALAVLQEEHIIHRDIHPKNKMLHSDGTVKLIDFDWAVEETKATVFKERAEYMAPEVYRKEKATCKADVWSVGYCVAWFRGNPRFGVPVDAFGMADPNLSRIKGSAAFMDFLQLALMTSVDERPSAVALLQHEFVQQTAGREKEIVRGILQRRL